MPNPASAALSTWVSVVEGQLAFDAHLRLAAGGGWEGQQRVDLRRLGVVRRTAGIGALLPVAPGATFGRSCPLRDFPGRANKRPHRW
jgi:hypothetical protein